MEAELGADPVTTAPAGTTVSWSDVFTRLSSEWASDVQATYARWRDAVEAAPDRYIATLKTYLSNCQEAWTHLEHIQATLAAHPDVPFAEKYAQNLETLRDRYYTLMSLVMRDARPAPATPTVGLAPILIGGIIFGVIALAAAAAYISHTQELRDWTAYLDNDLSARVEAMRTGKELQPSTAPSTPAEGDRPRAKGDWAWWQIGLGQGAAAGVGWLLLDTFSDRR